MRDLLRSLNSMASGECRWIIRPDIHVYRHSPVGREPRFCVVCPDAGLEHLPYDKWFTATEAVALIGTIS